MFPQGKMKALTLSYDDGKEFAWLFIVGLILYDKWR